MNRHKEPQYKIFAPLFAAGVAAVGYLIYVKHNLGQNPWVLKAVAADKDLGNAVSWPSILLYALLLLAVLASKKGAKKSWTKLDRLLLIVYLLEPLTSNVQLFLPSNYYLASHRYYFTVIEIACFVGWVIEKMPQWISSPKFRKVDVVLGAGVVLFEVFVLSQKDLTFLIYTAENPFNVLDNSILLLGVLPMLYFFVWGYFRFEKHLAFTKRASFVVCFFLVMTLCGYGFRPSQLKEANANFPFEGAYEWFEENAEKDEVVLTVSPLRYFQEDYLILHTDLKAYISHRYGQLFFSNDEEGKKIRSHFYSALLTGRLKEETIRGTVAVKDKLELLRLDYLLVDLPSPFLKRIQSQLGAWIEEVYRDEKCLIYRVE